MTANQKEFYCLRQCYILHLTDLNTIFGLQETTPPAAPPTPAAAPPPPPASAPPPPSPPAAQAIPTGDRLFVSPLAKKLAQERGINLAVSEYKPSFLCMSYSSLGSKYKIMLGISWSVFAM